METYKALTIIIVSVLVAACDSGSSSSYSSTKTVEDCRSEVDRAVRSAGSDERDMIRAGDKALEDCMRR